MEIYAGTQSVTYSGLAKDTVFDYVLRDQDTMAESVSSTVTSTSKGVVTIPIPVDNYSHWYGLTISDNGMTVMYDSIDIVTPLVKTADILAYMEGKVTPNQAVEYERTARLIIEALLNFPFDFKRKELHLVGNGTDFLVTNERVVKVHSVKENNEYLWQDGDTEDAFVPFSGLDSIVRESDDADNRLEFKMTWSTRYAVAEFKENYDYVVDADCGWPAIPNDIREAALLIINDLHCGNNRYSNKYIRTAGAQQQKVDYFYRVTAGTGNVIVDKILSKYALESVRVKVL